MQKNHAADFMKNMMNGLGNDLNVMMIGQIKSYDDTKKLAEVIPLHHVPGQDIEYNPLVSVPCAYYSIGGFSIKVKPKAGDRILIIYCDYDIENLLIGGSKQPKTEHTHSLNDAIVIPLSVSFVNESNDLTDDLVIRKDGTSAYVKITQSGDIVLNGNSIKLGENATTKILLQGGTYGTPSSKVYAE